MATGGSAPNFSAGSIATAGGLTVELINRLINVQLSEVRFRRKVSHRCKHCGGL